MTQHAVLPPGRRPGPSAEPLRVEAVQERFENAYHRTQYEFVQFFTEHLVDCARSFDQDFDQMLVMAVLGQRRLEGALGGLPADPPELDRVCMTASRIADVTGLPRETVRRKLLALKARGWIENDPQRGWYIASSGDRVPARDAFGEFAKRFSKRLAKLHVRLSHIVQDGPGG
ncbi:helix-turn-helix domain-containing protein [Rubellimicrobium roseum]|uniref:Helix-turn-helix domain-containing protein n=1 Tax=Rubellimicrobium roseum TaxID=687525 RepID=A0A5C4NBX2_9RHOB|nr:helix-turn-helix domain-containing protein [Rubellimicrobium roseum]TNC65387.1 helix-turn-helix domain-containing protein [Rubellimicrobium roseum]